MYIGVTGIVINEYNDVLLIRRDDTRTWAPPGGILNEGELPPDGTAREVRKETGVIAMPVRLVGLEYVPVEPAGTLNLVFRCIMRGGEPTPTEEAAEIGFLPYTRLPTPMLSLHRNRIHKALEHRGGPPVWYAHEPAWWEKLAHTLFTNVVYRFNNVRRNLQEPSAGWQVSAYVVVQDDGRRVLWVKREGRGPWHLPGGQGEDMESPWETAVRQTRLTTGIDVELLDLAGVYVYPTNNNMTFIFTADAVSGHIKENVRVSYLIFGEESRSTFSKHVEHVRDALNPEEETIFRAM